MRSLHHHRLWSCAVALTAVSALGAISRAAPLDDRIPADAITYIGWAGADKLQPQFNASNLKGVIDASTIRDVLQKQLPTLMREAGIRDNPDDKVAALIHKLALTAWQHPTAFYFRPVDFSNPQQPLPSFGFICDAGAEAKDLAQTVQDAIAMDPPPPNFKLHIVVDGTFVHMSIGSDDTPADLKKGGGLAGAAAFKAAMNNARETTPALAVYVDVAKGIAAINEGLSKVPDVPPEAKQRIPSTLENLGLNGLSQVAYTMGFEGKAWGDHLFIGTTGPRKGLLAMIGNSPLSDAALAMVPKDAAAFSAWKMDLHGFFTQTRDLVGKIEPAAQKEMDQGLAQVAQETGINVEKDVLAPLGDEWVLYRAAPPEGGAPSIALVHKLKDGPAFAKTVAAIEKFANEALKGSPVKIDKVSAAKTEVSTIAFLQYNVAWVVKDGILYIAPIEAIGGAIKQVANKSPSILESDLYKTARAALPAAAKPFVLSYSNPARLYPQLRVLGLGVMPLLRSNGIDIPNSVLPDPDDIAPFMTPGASMMWSEADGIHATSRSAFPGAQLLSGEQLGPASIATVGLTAGIMIPSLGRAREMAGRTVNATNVRGVAVACAVWEAQHKGMPDDLAQLCAAGVLSPGTLASRGSGTEPLQMTPELEKLAKDNFAKFAEQIAQHSDVVYLGKGMTSMADPGFVVVYEKPHPGTTDGIVAAFGDGHAEFVAWGRLRDTFKKTNDTLKKNGHTEVDFAALFKEAGVSMPVDARDLP